MTRNEMKSQKWFQMDREQIYSLIDRLYDNFESRTCANCKHFTEGFSGMILCELLGEITSESNSFDVTFGCNKWDGE